MSVPSTEIRHADINDAQQTLEVRWGDEHASVYPLKYLRAECPCANCRAERDAARANPFHVIKTTPSAKVMDIEAVGRYALRFAWGDGHDTGIYTFEYLREICPCEACAAARPKDTAPFVHGIHIPNQG
jgi:DUF971 family protein